MPTSQEEWFTEGSSIYIDLRWLKTVSVAFLDLQILLKLKRKMEISRFEKFQSVGCFFFLICFRIILCVKK